MASKAKGYREHRRRAGWVSQCKAKVAWAVILIVLDSLNLVKGTTACASSSSVDEANGWYWSRNL